MSRRDQRTGDGRRYGSRKKTLFQIVLALSAGRPVFTADYYAVDGVSGKVAAFVDWNDPTHTLAQGTAANQVALPAAHADFAGQMCATFDHTAASGAGNFYVSNRSPSGWTQYINGTGYLFSCTLTQTAGISTQFVSTLSGGAFPSFFFSTLTGSGVFDQARFVIANDTGAFAVDATGANGSIQVNVPGYYRFSYEEGIGAPEYTWRRRGTTLASGSSATAPGSNNPLASLNLGRRANGTVPASMRWRDLFFGPRSTQFDDALAAYELATNGLAA